MTRIVVQGIGAFEVSPLPGQPQVAHCHALFVSPEKRGLGLGKALKEAQNAYLQDHMFDYAICTVRWDNDVQKHILKQAEWQRRDMFFDRRQDCLVEVWCYHVRN